MSDRVQPGVKIDPALWEEFRDAVRERRGGVRGHLRSELETAIRFYISDGETASAVQVNNRLARMERELGITSADGGVDTSEASPHTHAPPTADPEPITDKPGANAPTDKKVRYLARQLEQRYESEVREVHRNDIRDVVKEEYGFRRDTAKRYVDQLITHFDLKPHPKTDKVLLTPERLNERKSDNNQDNDNE